MDDRQPVLSFSKTGDGLSITAGESLTIYEVAAAHQALLAQTAHLSPCRIDLSATQEFDTAALQLLLTLDRELQTRGWRLQLKACSDTVAQSLRLFQCSLAQQLDEEA